MKKLILLFAVAVLGITADAQRSKSKENFITGNGVITEETRKVEPYHTITLKGGYDLILTNEPQGAIRVVGEENINPIIITEVKDGVLEVSLKPKYGYMTKKKKQYVYASAKDLKALNVLGTSDAKNEGDFNASDLKITIKGSSDVKLKNVVAQNIDVNIDGSGDVELGGKTENLNVKIKGSGDVEAFELKTKNADIKVDGIGDVEIFATESFVGELKGSGSIKVKGNPKKVNQKKQGIGKIKIL